MKNRTCYVFASDTKPKPKPKQGTEKKALAIRESFNKKTINYENCAK